ncbi:MAG: response regulator [Patescibacteria group bacterium]|nr:response regulator [Patescibacteria group bacterium]
MYNLLLVDDEQTILDVLERFINKSFDNINIFVALDGEKALNIFNNNNIDIIISDIYMPIMSGIDLLSKIKKIDDTSLFVLTSSSLDNNILLEAINLDVDRVLPKPISNKTLEKVILKLSSTLKIRENNLYNANLLKEYKAAIDDSTLVSKTNSSGIITYVNDAFCKISGFTREELLGKNHNIVRNPSCPKSKYKEIWDTIQSKKVWKGEVTNKTKYDTFYTVLATINPILNKNGEIYEYISIRHDITNEVRLREYMSKQLEEKDSCINQTNKEMVDTQREMILTLGEVAETRSQETGLHVKRVSEYSYLLATLYGLSDIDASTLRSVSPMHDVGKVGIPDSILNKPGKLTPGEFELMKEHAVIGYEMLNKSDRPLIKAASIIAHEHHERWNGTGYPNGKKGKDIHIFARITAVADVFDALGHDRVYKKAWPIDDILKLLKEERGKHFDPSLIDLFFANLSMFLDLKNKFDD